MVGAALKLVSVSVAFGVLSGAFSVVAGLREDSLGVFGAGLSLLADVTGSSALIWRFLAERRRPARSGRAEARAAALVAIALVAVGAVVGVESVLALTARSRPGTSAIPLAAAGASLVVLTPLAYAKRRLGRRMGSRALEGDGGLSAIGAAISLLALAGLVLYRVLGWWWPDRLAGVAVAALAAAEAWRVAPRSGDPGAGAP